MANSFKNKREAQMVSPTLQARKKESYKIFDQIAGTYDFLNHTLSFGIDILWRKKFHQKLPSRDHLQVLDLATGTADVPLELIKNTHVQHVTGIDLSEEMLRRGQKKILKRYKEKQINLRKGDAVHIPFPNNSFDVVTISFGIRNFNDPDRSLRDIYRVLKPGGRLIIMEFFLPRSFLVRMLYLFYFRYLLPFIGNIVSRHRDAYSYLNKTVEDFPYGKAFENKMIQAGFSKTGFETLTFGIAGLYWGDKQE